MAVERLIDSINALCFKRCSVSVQTSSGEIGSVIKTQVWTGLIKIVANGGKVVMIQGRDVYDLDTVPRLKATTHANRE